MDRRAARAASVSAAALVLAGCAGPTRGDTDYRLKLANTAQAIASEVQTAILVAVQAERGRAFQRYAADVISRAEDDASSAQQAFDTRQPPDPAGNALRSKADQTLQNAVSALTDLRVTIRAGDVPGLAPHVRQLRKLLPGLEKLQQVAA